ncbi:hypothetical protein [Maribacter sp. 2210JD10-5]|uniref:hypothetical protein n=1 Tax=Maribacter sp. 2210JD10-5 TaxID=3386272 RepID=UPI0039BD0EBB
MKDSFVLTLIIAFFLLGNVQNTQAQFLKKLQKKIEQKVEQKADEKTDELLNGKDKKTIKSKEENPTTKTPSENKTQKTVEPVQKKSKNNKDFSKDPSIITYASPSEHFNDFVLLTHKGTPRFGDLNLYNPANKGYAEEKEYHKKMKLINTGFQCFKSLVNLKYSDTFMKNLDTEKPTTNRPSSSDQKTRNNEEVQHMLRNMVAPNFCNSDACKNMYLGDNEFELLRNYRNFTKEVLPDLLKWSKTFFKEDSQIIYYVSRVTPRSYDFEKKGFWGSLSFNLFGPRQSGNLKLESHFEPKAQYESTINDNLGPYKNIQFLIPIDVAVAESFQKNKNMLYLVRKIKLSIPSEPRENLSLLKFSYYHESPIIDIYQDAALTQKITSISFEELILKK